MALLSLLPPLPACDHMMGRWSRGTWVSCGAEPVKKSGPAQEGTTDQIAGPSYRDRIAGYAGWQHFQRRRFESASLNYTCPMAETHYSSSEPLRAARDQFAGVMVSLAFATQSALSFISKMFPDACALKCTREGHSATLTQTS